MRLLSQTYMYLRGNPRGAIGDGNSSDRLMVFAFSFSLIETSRCQSEAKLRFG